MERPMKKGFLRRNDKEPEGPANPPILGSSSNDLFFLEQFKAFRAKFEQMIDMLGHRIVAVTSSVAGEGKTLSVTNLAVNLAGVGRKKVLVIDADLRKCDVAAGLNVRPRPGLTEYLYGAAGMADIVRHSSVPGLDVIPAGMRLANHKDLLAGDPFRSLIGRIREGGEPMGRYDVVLLDTPPILPVADTLSLKDQVDAFIFVYRTGFTPYKMLQQALEETGDAKVLGVVLNGVEPGSQRYYRRYYGKYYKSIGREEAA
jgi:capsular exopolysaccharide synthesis family protein